MTTKRIFFALWPDDRQRDRLRDQIRPLAKLVEGQVDYRGDWHVTTAFIGSFPEADIPGLLARAAEIPVEPFRLRFDRVEFWPRPKVASLVAPTVPPELQRLVDAHNALLADYGVAFEDRTYRPHITVVRRARPFETQRLAQPAVVDWTGFELVESVSQPGGATYHPLKQ
ncbi:MAG TPA: RNA 2',3'-cyclic phosphodiesterase [Woeseiaceae bacterium]|nr:RNA 2',3'-cyclic phosphodiesterase [Woeseiaceae bacterium]